MADESLIGRLVYSLKGRDQDRPFLVVGQVNARYVLLADGDLRRLSKPKLKNVHHLRITGIKSEELVTALARGEPLDDHRLKKLVRELAGRLEEAGKEGPIDG